MKTITIYLTLLLLSIAMYTAQAQNDTIASKESRIQTLKQNIIDEEKAALKIKLEGIEYRLKREYITQEEADKLKSEAAEYHALNIENRIAIMENEAALRQRKDEEGGDYIEIFGDGKLIHYSQSNRKMKRPYDRRTSSDLVLAVGLNNAISDENSLDDSDFKLAGSRFFEIGWAWKTRVFDNSNWLRVKYGFSFQFNGLKPTDNRYFVENGDLTQLEEFPLDLNKSKFRMDNLVIPVHFEFGPSDKDEREEYFRYSTHDKFKIGIGGYAGINIGERQKLKYKEDGDKVKDKLKGDYNTNDVVYGLSSYVSLGGVALYAKYDLSPIFKDPNIELRNISFGLRFDID
ncbi:hypothetical protein L1I30_10090 [Gillisia sp. M10.2A]|uniref:Outer membrane protein beta-barrel domain-containing protein n=1 Tax=Gillisia lutea TaxID=2909668 RepID=A0ABS9EGM9_9FLAO|nr:hypothetical protein [Gillisia lutea]MCF4102017.1 hypothetical protein [Gillisia lutea]